MEAEKKKPSSAQSGKPKVSVVVPCRGLDAGFDENISSLLGQSYANCGYVFVLDSPGDPALGSLKRVASACGRRVKIVFSQRLDGCSGKIAALLAGVASVDADTDVLAFADSDARVSNRWLSGLAEPLADPGIGATTGFRWYFPVRGGFWSHAQSAWNATGTNRLLDPRFAFAWGGACAIRRSDFERLKVAEPWRRSLSDDLTLTRIVKSDGKRIEFVPSCMAATFQDASWRSLLDWSFRQTLIVKHYMPMLWLYAAAAFAFFDLTFLAGLYLAFASPESPPLALASGMMLAQLPLGIVRSWRRQETFRRLMLDYESEFRRNRLGHVLASPATQLIMTIALLRSLVQNKFTWRGTSYEIRGPHDVSAVSR